MKVIDYKHQMKASNFRKVMALLRVILIGLNLFKWRFEVVKTNKTYQLKFYIIRSKLSMVEERWLDNKITTYIDEMEN